MINIRFYVSFVFAFLSFTPVLYGQEVTVGQNVLVSEAYSNRAHYEIHLSADPNDSSKLVGASMVWNKKKGDYQVVAYVSSDRGEIWTPTFMSKIYYSMMDPAVAHGPDGQVYMSMFGYPEDYDADMLFYRSTNGGKSWSKPVKIPGMDREFIAVDNTDGKYRGRIYLNGTRGVRKIDGGRISGISILWSKDGGVSFNGPFTRVSSGDKYVYPMGNGIVLSDGTYVALFGEVVDVDKIRPEEIPSEANAKLKVLRSKDGGETFEKAKVVSEWYQFERQTGSIPSMAVDKSEGPFKDRIYVAWNDFRSGRGEIFLSYSSDKGKTWSSPVAVDGDIHTFAKGKGPDNFMPVVAVNKKGVVGVMWYDRRDRPDNTGWNVRFAASMDGGETFRPSVKVSEKPFEYDLSKGLVVMGQSTGGGHPSEYLQGGNLNANVSLHHFNDKGGDTAGMEADAGGIFHPFWVDNRTSVPQIWTANVIVEGKAIGHGSAELANLDDVTNKVTLELSGLQFNEETHTGSVELVVRNTSKDHLQLPLKGRILDVDSQLGYPAIVSTEQNGAGAVLDFSDKVDGKTLSPGAKTAPITLTFRLDNFRELDQIKDLDYQRGGYSFINIEMKMLSREKD